MNAYHDLVGDIAGERGVGDEHNGRRVDDYEVVFLLEFVDYFGIMLGPQEFCRVGGNIAARNDKKVLDFRGENHFFGVHLAEEYLGKPVPAPDAEFLMQTPLTQVCVDE